jgi:hypothetical protein
MTKTKLITAIVCAIAGVGCAGRASLVRSDVNGGRVVLQGAYMASMADARLLMGEHCRGSADVAELGAQLEFRCREPVSTPRSQELTAQAHAFGEQGIW